MRKPKKFLVVLLTLAFLFSTAGLAFASPTVIYGELNGQTVMFEFDDIINAYGNNIVQYQNAWENANKISMQYEGKAVSWEGFINAVGNGQATNPDEYANSSDARLVDPPAKVKPVKNDGNLGDEIDNPNVQPEVVEIVSVSAVKANGSANLEVVLSAVPEETPTAPSVDVKRYINGELDETFVWSGGTSSWDEATKTLRIIGVALPEATNVDQEVVYSVAYGDSGNYVESNAVTVEAEALLVESVSVINATTVEVQLKEAPAADLTDADAGKFTVLENGNPVAVSGVAKKAADLSGKTYRLTVTSLNGKQGDLSVNGTAAAVPAGKVYAFDFKAPDVSGIVARGTKTLEVTFSEKMDSDSVNKDNFLVKKVVPVTGLDYSIETAVLSADGRNVTITLDKDLLVADYVLVLGPDSTQVKDVAGNGIPAKTEMSFRPTAEQLADTTAPALTRATYNTVKGELTLTFNKNILDSTLDVTKLSINGYALTVNDVVNTGTTADDNVVVIAFSAASKDAVNAMTGALTLTAAKDAYGDASKLTAGETFTIVREEPAVIKSASYNQETNLLTVTFDKPVTLEAGTVASVGVADAPKVNPESVK